MATKHNDSSKKEKGQQELEEKVLYVNRSSKVIKGGRKYGFSALVVVGDRKGRIGYGFGKANELTDAIRKAGELARRNTRTFAMRNTTIPHEVLVKSDGAHLLLQPAPIGAGVIAGSHARSVLELAGIKDIMAKNLGTSTPVNVVRATFKALGSLRTREAIKRTRGISS